MDYKIGEKVELIIGVLSPIGFSVLINEEVEGLLYKNEVYVRLEEGQRIEGYIKKIREDGKYDVSLQAVGFKNTLVSNQIKILNALRANDGFLNLHDKSNPDDIKYALEMSKKAFKNAIGVLYRNRVITIEEDGIRLKIYE